MPVVLQAVELIQACPSPADCLALLGYETANADYVKIATTWFWDSWYELKNYVQAMGRAQWMVLSAVTCALGFMMLRGNPIKM